MSSLTAVPISEVKRGDKMNSGFSMARGRDGRELKDRDEGILLSRRSFVAGASLASAVLSVGAARAEDACAIFTPDLQKATTPEAALQLLKDGNARFVAGKTVNCDLMAQVKATGKGQAPFAAIVGCIDSRVPPELVFDQHIGDIFAARIAGNFINDDIIGSLEFATKVAGAKAIVVLGHSECGAVKGAIDGAELGLLTQMLDKIKPSMDGIDPVGGTKSSENKPYVQAVADNNVKLAAKALFERSAVIKELVDSKQVIVASAMHNVATGVVTFF
jgi:carbonic anhydrase